MAFAESRLPVETQQQASQSSEPLNSASPTRRFSVCVCWAQLVCVFIATTNGGTALVRVSRAVPFVVRGSHAYTMNYPMTVSRREELEDLLNDPLYFQAIFHSLDRVKVLYQSQAELGMANESIASTLLSIIRPWSHRR